MHAIVWNDISMNVQYFTTEMEKGLKYDLWDLIRSAHKKVKYPCAQCEYKATQKVHLKSHIESVHEKVKYPCTQCEYKVTTQGSLKRHIGSVHDRGVNAES